jgi:2-phosphoglycerate kinase
VEKVETVPLLVIGPEGPRPFMRGILVQSLVSRGVPFDVAFDVATKINGRLSGRDYVQSEELPLMVEELIGDQFDLEAPLHPTREPPRVVGSQGTSEPFSKGILSVSLEGAGLEPSDAYEVAKELEARLYRAERGEIERSELGRLVVDTIALTHGQRAAERYRVWRRTLEEGRPIFLLLGGATGVGKTSIAIEVARRLEITRVLGSDLIRQIMRLMFSPDLMPEIHCSTYDAAQALKPELRGTGDPVIVAFREQAQKIAVGVYGMLDRALEENTSMILEGAHLLPGIIDVSRYAQRAHVIFQAVATLDTEAFQRRFTTRAMRAREREQKRYMNYFQEIALIQDHILKEAEQHGLPIIDNVRIEDAILSTIRSVLATLEKQIEARTASAAS